MWQSHVISEAVLFEAFFFVVEVLFVLIFHVFDPQRKLRPMIFLGCDMYVTTQSSRKIPTDRKSQADSIQIQRPVLHDLSEGLKKQI